MIEIKVYSTLVFYIWKKSYLH